MAPLFRNRSQAGQALGERLARYAGRTDVVVLALPRGGVPVGSEVARRLRAPLDAIVVKKLGLPGHEELAMGAIASGGALVLNAEVVGPLGVPREVIDAAARRAEQEIARRERLYRGLRPPLSVRGRTVIVVDDGLATGSTMKAAVAAIRKMGPARIVVAVPVAAEPTCRELAREADEILCLETPEPFYAVGQWYEDFSQTSDEEVREKLGTQTDFAVQREQQGKSDCVPSFSRERSVMIPADGTELAGDLTIPQGARGVVVFAHGSGSSRFSPRNCAVARELAERGLATLLFDLLTAREEEEERWTRHLRFDIELLARRLVAATAWLARAEPGLAVGYFGSSTGAAAALVAAARRPDLGVRAIVSRGGRPDLAGPALATVRAPTLLVVGGEDHQVIALNRAALEALAGPKELRIVPGATHLFEEPGALEEVTRLAHRWFARFLEEEAEHHVPP